MRFERSMIAVGAAATLLLAAAGAHAYAAGDDALAVHLMLALAALLAAALPHLWTLFYLFGTRRALAREPGGAAARATGRRAVALAVAAALAALAAGTALALTGAHAYTGRDGGLHGGLFWALLAIQPLALAVEWRALAENARLLARHGG